MYICEVNYILTFKSRSYEKQMLAVITDLPVKEINAGISMERLLV